MPVGDPILPRGGNFAPLKANDFEFFGNQHFIIFFYLSFAWSSVGGGLILPWGANFAPTLREFWGWFLKKKFQILNQNFMNFLSIVHFCTKFWGSDNFGVAHCVLKLCVLRMLHACDVSELNFLIMDHPKKN